MKNKNICKFITDTVSEKLELHQFIYETDADTMKLKVSLMHNRAILIKQGSGKIFTDNECYNIEAGNLIICFKNESVSVCGEKGIEYMYIDFGGARSEVLFHRFCINKNNRIFSGFDSLIPLWQDSLCRAVQINLDLVSESVLLYTFSRLVANESRKNNIINKILELTEENFTSSELSVSVVADELSYNAKYISHIFKENMGISYTEHLRNLRIKYAVSLLEHGIDSVKNIAFLSGFTDPLYFSTVFKNTVGVSPKEYKKRFLEK